MGKPRKPKPRWVRRTYKLQDDHGWTARPGCKIFVADRGAVRFDFPESWVVVPGEQGSIKFHDRTPPDDDCTLEVSVMYLPEGDWSGLPLATLVRELDARDKREVLERQPIVEGRRPRCEFAWSEVRFLDRGQNREAFSRLCLARWSNIQPLITFAYWADDAPRCVPVWDDVLASLVIGDYIEDPTRRVLD